MQLYKVGYSTARDATDDHWWGKTVKSEAEFLDIVQDDQ